MEMLQQHLGEIMIGLSGTFLTLFIKGYQSLMGRIKKLENDQIKLRGLLDTNTALDEMERKK